MSSISTEIIKQKNREAFQIWRKCFPAKEIKPLTADGTPRAYQVSIKNEFFKHVKKGLRIVSIEVGTGLGKTRICAMIGERVLRRGKKVVVISPNKMAMGNYDQGNINDWRQVLQGKYKIGLVNGNLVDSDVLFFTINEFVRLSREDKVFFKYLMKKVGLIVLDEVHRMPQDDPMVKEATKIIGKIEFLMKSKLLCRKIILTCTATHTRMDQLLPLGKDGPDEDMKYTLADGIRDGYAPDIYGLPVLIHVDAKGATKVADAYDLNLNKQESKEYIDQIVDNFYQMHFLNKRAGHVFFVRTVADANDFVRELNKKLGWGGFVVLSGHTPDEERLQIVEDIISEKLLGYVTVNVGGEAINIPRLEVAHLVVRTTSIGKLVQNIGRITRQYTSKDGIVKNKVTVVDYRILRNHVLRGCLGLWDFAKKEGSLMFPSLESVKIGASLFTKSVVLDNEKNDLAFKSLTYGEVEAWLTQATMTEEAKRIAQNLVDLKAMIDADFSRPRKGEPLFNELHNYLNPEHDMFKKDFYDYIHNHKNAKNWVLSDKQTNSLRAQRVFLNSAESCINLPEPGSVKYKLSFNKSAIEAVLLSGSVNKYAVVQIRRHYPESKLTDDDLIAFARKEVIVKKWECERRELLALLPA